MLMRTDISHSFPYIFFAAFILSLAGVAEAVVPLTYLILLANGCTLRALLDFVFIEINTI
jgi:hypothetical protein